MQFTMLTPIQIDGSGPIYFLDYQRRKVLDSDGVDHSSRLKGIFGDLEKIDQDPEVPAVDDIFQTAMNLQKRVFEENEETINGAQRVRYQDFRPRSGGEKAGKPESVDAGEDD